MTSCDLIIIGAGPAGLTAAIYARRQGLKTVVFGDIPGGNLFMIAAVQNYPGFAEGIAGMQLGAAMYMQAQAEGAEFPMANLEELEKDGSRFRGTDTAGNQYSAPLAIMASGAKPKPLAVENADIQGVHHCALCDGPLYRGKDATLMVVGGGDRGAHLAVALAPIARQVILVDQALTLPMSTALQRALSACNNVQLLPNTKVLALLGDTDLTAVRVTPANGEQFDIAVNGLFSAAGWTPNTAMLRFPLSISPTGYLLTDSHLMTSCTGLFAAGDVRDSDVKQIITACADGAHAAVHAAEYLLASRL